MQCSFPKQAQPSQQRDKSLGISCARKPRSQQALDNQVLRNPEHTGHELPSVRYAIHTCIAGCRTINRDNHLCCDIEPVTAAHSSIDAKTNVIGHIMLPHLHDGIQGVLQGVCLTYSAASRLVTTRTDFLDAFATQSAQ